MEALRSEVAGQGEGTQRALEAARVWASLSPPTMPSSGCAQLRPPAEIQPQEPTNALEELGGQTAPASWGTDSAGCRHWAGALDPALGGPGYVPAEDYSSWSWDQDHISP